MNSLIDKNGSVLKKSGSLNTVPLGTYLAAVVIILTAIIAFAAFLLPVVLLVIALQRRMVSAHHVTVPHGYRIGEMWGKVWS